MRSRRPNVSWLICGLLAACGPGGADPDAGGPPADAEAIDGGRDTGPRPDTGPPCEESTFYRDADGDGHGDLARVRSSCEQPPGYVTSSDDCDDACADCHPGAMESCATSRDENCDGATDEAGCVTCGSTCAWSCSAAGCNDAVLLTAGGFHACAIQGAGTAVCWGQGEKLGAGDAADSAVPVRVIDLDGATQISAGFAHSCARMTDGTARCWGSNSTGQLGLGVLDPYVAMTALAVPGLTGVDAIAAGGTTASFFSCAAHGGRVSCWGSNVHGQLGNGDVSLERAPVETDPLAAAAAGVWAGGEHACALLVDGRVQCWGAGGDGQLGGDSTSEQHSPGAPIVGVAAVDQLALGANHTCALDGAGGVWCWGDNSHGQLGRAGPDALVPELVAGVTATQISAGGDITCAIDASGQAWCWGINGQGTVGDGTTVDRSAPTMVSSLDDAVEIEVGSSVVCARRVDSTLTCWGEGASGQLGNGTTTMSTTPVPVLRP